MGSLRAYGFDVGRSELHGKLDERRRAREPHRRDVRRRQGAPSSPQCVSSVEPGDVTFAKGKIVERAKLTPAVCARRSVTRCRRSPDPARPRGKSPSRWKRIAFRSPIPPRRNVKGQIMIHKATVSPGPVVGEIAKLLGAGSLTMTLANDTVVPIRVENGRVHHQNFSVQIGGYTSRRRARSGSTASWT